MNSLLSLIAYIRLETPDPGFTTSLLYHCYVRRGIISLRLITFTNERI